jgi:alkylation response protein AidB-like acyl-CoA dehydrogenase
MVKKAAALIDANRDAEKESHIAKLLASKASWQVRGINAHKGGIHITGFMLSKSVFPPPPCYFPFFLAAQRLRPAASHTQAAEVCMHVYGGYGFATEYDIERKWRENRLYQITPHSTNFSLSYLSEQARTTFLSRMCCATY